MSGKGQAASTKVAARACGSITNWPAPGRPIESSRRTADEDETPPKSILDQKDGRRAVALSHFISSKLNLAQLNSTHLIPPNLKRVFSPRRGRPFSSYRSFPLECICVSGNLVD